jgi:hypothetical protein
MLSSSGHTHHLKNGKKKYPARDTGRILINPHSILSINETNCTRLKQPLPYHACGI